MSAPTPTVEVIDELLAAWEERLQRVDENLIALEGNPAYRILAGKAGRRAVLDGVTRERAYPALDAVTDLFQQRAELAEVMARARAIRSSITALAFWDRDEKLAAILRLLRTPSIDLGRTATPLAARSLLDEPDRAIRLAPEAVLAEMVRAFEPARDVILAVARAWTTLAPTRDAIRIEIDALRALSVRSGGLAAREIEAADAELAALALRMQRDPLGCIATTAPPLIARLAAVRAQLEGAADTAIRTAAALDHARARLRSLDEDHARAAAAFAAAALEIEDAPAHLTAPIGAPERGGLDMWIEKLTTTVEARRFSAADVGLARFCEAVERYVAIDRQALEQAEAAISARAELRGRLSSRRAQAAALAQRLGIPAPAPGEAEARLAEELLQARPLSLDRATRAVEAYEAEVLALRRG